MNALPRNPPSCANRAFSQEMMVNWWNYCLQDIIYMIDVNYLAVIVSAIAAMVLGFLWYGPLFGTQWIAYMGWSEADMAAAKAKGMAKTYLIMTISTLVMSYVMAHAILFGTTYTNTFGAVGGLMGAFWYWLGFVAPVTLSAVLWEGKPWGYWFLTAGYYLVSLCMMGVILALWV